jgi:sialic acid synthase SpsE
MGVITLRNGREIADYGSPYVVAELNTSHNGDMDVAKRMIKTAREVGCSCVKFQSWSSESLYSRGFYKENPIAKRIVSKFALSKPQLLELVAYSKVCGIDFSSTPYSRPEVDFLVDQCAAPFIKIASMEITNYPFLEYIAKKGIPIVLSTGMSDFDEIRRAVSIIEENGNNKICILHCISIYPAEISTMQLKNILGLRQVFPSYPIGFSDHSLGTEMATAAVALGAGFIEKHFTLDKSKIGLDNQMATEPGEMAQLVRHCGNVHLALGSTERIIFPEEFHQRKKMRRSVIAAHDLKAETMLTADDLDAKRPGTGLAPEKIKELIGKKLLRDVEAETMIVEADINSQG